MEGEYEYQATRPRRYLRYLLSRAHEAGVPYLPVDELTDCSVMDWIDYLRPRVELLDEVDRRVAAAKEEEEASASPYLLTPARSRAPDGYRPPFDTVPEAFDHDHLLDTYVTEDEHDIVYCTLCSQEW